MQKKAVVLYSAGLDSTTCLALAREAGFAPYAISFDYGQRHCHELTLAKAHARTQGAVEHLVVSFDLRQVGGSALTSSAIAVRRLPPWPCPSRSPMYRREIPSFCPLP